MRYALILALVLTASQAWAGGVLLSGHGITASSATCAQGSNYSDGCPGAATDGNYQNPDFFAYAKQTSQGSYHAAGGAVSAHPPPWNVAGLDYPVGYSISGAGGSLKDPAVASLPASCTYAASGSPSRGGPWVNCTGSGSITINGFDNSLHNCVPWRLGTGYTTVVVTNNKWSNGTGCGGTAIGTSCTCYFLALLNGATANVDIEQNYLDGDDVNFPTSITAMLWINGGSGSLTVKYNAVFRSPTRPVTSGNYGAWLVAFNYWEGFVYNASDGHGEVMFEGWFNHTQPSVTYSFNTGLQPNNVLASGSTTVFYPTATSGGVSSVITAVQVDHNTTVINKRAGNVTTAAAVAEIDGVTAYGTCLWDTNYLDNTGAFFDFGSVQSASCTSTFTGNINMLSGGTTNGTYNNKSS